MDIFKIVSSPVHVIYRLHSNPTKKVEIIDTHRRGEGEGKYSTPPLANFKTLVYKNAIKPEIGGPPLAIFPESLDPNFKYHLSWIFNPRVSMVEIFIK